MAWACVMAASIACSQGDKKPPYIPDPPTSDSGPITTTDAANDAPSVSCTGGDGGCNSLLNCGNKVFVVENPSTAPAAVGGTVPDGTYVLTAVTRFTGPGGDSGTLASWSIETMKITTEPTDASVGDGGAIQQMVWQDIAANDQAPANATSTGTAYFQAPSSLAIEVTCPAAVENTGSFTVSGTQLLVYVSDTSGTSQLTYTKQ